VTRDEIIALADRYELATYKRADVVAVRGEGSWIVDMDGRRYLDLYGGHAVTLLGHSPARLVDAIANQARDLLFYSNVVHCPARARAAAALVRLSPYDEGQVFFCNSGAEANETALKMARKATGRTRVMTYRGCFHGRTLGVLAASDLAPRVAQADPIVPPETAYHLAPWGELPDESCAAVLVEPIQSMGGMRVLDFAAELRARCDEVGAMLIFDQIQTAPARTGAWFFDDVTPDLITTAKSVAGGFPAAVVIAPDRVARTVEIGDQGTTFGGGPVAAAAIETTLAMLEEMDGPARARAIEAQVRERFPEARGRGALLAVRAPGAVGPLRTKHGVLVGACPGDPDLVRLMPPLTITEEELASGLDAIAAEA